MKLVDILTILAILTGPIISVQIQKLLDKRKENTAQKLKIFKALMATRGSHASFEYVSSLNMIDIEFNGVKKVQRAWVDYLSCLCDDYDEDTGEKAENWFEKNDKLFINLLYCMAENLGYHFNKDYLKKAIYRPKNYNDEEQYQQLVRKYIRQLIYEEKTLPVSLKKTDISSNSHE